MITDIESNIKEKLLTSGDKNDLTFLKYSTPISGKGVGGKIILFVFETGKKEPSFVVKTVRSSSDNNVVQKGYDNLVHLNKLVPGNMFPKALLLKEVGTSVWSIETYCHGRRADFFSDQAMILTAYNSFAKQVLVGHKKTIKLDKEYGARMIRGLVGESSVINQLLRYNDSLWGDEMVVLPEIFQHGDITIDNVVIEDHQVKFIDCDLFSDITIPGFDIFHFFSRARSKDLVKSLKQHFEQLGIEYSPDQKLLFLYFLHELYIKKDYCLQGKSARSVIESFELLFKTTAIVHISRMNFLSHKAHVYTTTKTCEALAEVPELQVTLISPDNSLRHMEAEDAFFATHDIQKKFDIVSLDSWANRLKKSKWRIVNWLETIAVNLSLTHYLITHRRKFDVLYYRDWSLGLSILVAKFLLKKPIFIELHAVLHRKHAQYLNNFFTKISDGVITISYGLQNYYTALNPRDLVAFCAAAEPDRFALINEDKKELRRQLGLPLDKVILMYSGNLFKTGNNDSYGIEDIVSAMPYVDDSIIFIGVGKKGSETKDHEDLAKRLGVGDRVIFLPWVGKQEVYRFWKAADILMLPAAGAQIGNSPTKMFEYLAAHKPIISARTIPIAEVLVHEQNALLVDDYQKPEAWADAIKRITTDKDLETRLVARALVDSQKYTWSKRGASIGSFILETLKEKS